jgi:hypothetical protein
MEKYKTGPKLLFGQKSGSRSESRLKKVSWIHRFKCGSDPAFQVNADPDPIPAPDLVPDPDTGLG